MTSSEIGGILFLVPGPGLGVKSGSGCSFLVPGLGVKSGSGPFTLPFYPTVGKGECIWEKLERVNMIETMYGILREIIKIF